MMAFSTFRASERQAPHLNIRQGAIAITVGASLTASLCARLVKVPRNAYYYLNNLLQNISGVSNMRFFLMSWFILSLLSNPLWASEEGQLTIGVASITSSNIYAGASNETRVLPGLKYSKGAFLVAFKEGASYQLSPLQEIIITVSVVPRF